MKLNISYPATGQQKCLDIMEDRRLRAFYDKRISHEVDGEALGDEYKGYKFRISGGNDMQGFPMMQGVLTRQRVRLLLNKNSKCYRPRRKGERKRKSVRGCIVSHDLSVLHLVIVQKGEQDIPGLTDEQRPRRLGPKRASKIRTLFNLEKEDDVRQFVIRRKITKDGKDGKKGCSSKAPKIQRLVTPIRLQRKRAWKAEKRSRWKKSHDQAEEYSQLLQQHAQELKEERLRKRESKRRSTVRKSVAVDK